MVDTENLALLASACDSFAQALSAVESPSWPVDVVDAMRAAVEAVSTVSETARNPHTPSGHA